MAGGDAKHGRIAKKLHIRDSRNIKVLTNRNGR